MESLDRKDGGKREAWAAFSSLNLAESKGERLIEYQQVLSDRGWISTL